MLGAKHGFAPWIAVQIVQLYERRQSFKSRESLFSAMCCVKANDG